MKSAQTLSTLPPDSHCLYLLFPTRSAVGRTVAVVIIIIAIALAGVVVAYYETSQTPVNNVKFSLGFPVTYFAAPYFYGMDLGYYKQNGINVTILPGTSGPAAISAVSTGQVDFAMGDVSGVIYALAHSNITNVRIVAVFFPKSFLGIVYNKAVISTLSDLNGKSGGAGTPATTPATGLFLAVAKLNGLNVSSMKMQYASTLAVQPLVATGQLDFVVTAAQEVAGLSVQAAKSGIQLGFFPFYEYGLDNYGVVLVTSTSMIQNHGPLVQRFVKAALQSMTAGILNPQSAVQSLVKHNPQLNQTLMIEGWNLDISCCLQGVTASTNPLAFGYINPQRMQQTVNNLYLGMGASPTPNATRFYTDAYTTPP